MRVEALITRSMEALVRIAGRVPPGLVAGAALLFAALLPRAWIEAGPSFCPFRLASGLPCPGCGLTRSVVALAHGDPAASLYFHPLGLPVVAALVGLVVLELGLALRRRAAGQTAGSPSTTALLERAARGPVLWLGAASLAVVWVVRIPLFLSGTWIF